MTKYTGTIFGIQPNDSPNIYHIGIEDKRVYIWKANIVAILQNRVLKIVFNWNGDSFEMALKEIKPNYFSGKQYRNHEEDAEVFLWTYYKEDDLLFKGTSTENKNNEFFILGDLRPFKE